MKYQLFKSVLALGLAGVSAAPSFAAEKDPIAALLDQQEIKYEIDKEKNYKITYQFKDEKRSQLVFVSGTVEEYDGAKIRTIFAPAVRLSQNPMDGQLKALLEHNGKTKMGAWEISGDVLYFAARLVEPLTAQQLGSMLNLVASVADDKEIEITGDKDEL